MSLFLISNLSVCISSLVMILLLLLFGKTKTQRTWAFCNIAVFCWGIGTTLIAVAKQPNLAFIGWEIALVGGYFISIFYYHTVNLLVENKTGQKSNKFLILGYLFTISSAIFTLIRPDLVIPSLRLMFGSIYYPNAGLGYSIIFSGWAVIAFVSSYKLIRLLKLSNGFEQMQIKYLLFTFIIGYIGGGSAHLPSWGINIYPFGNFGIALYAIIGTYAILRHRLMEIDVLVKRTVIFTGMFAFIFGVVVTIAILVAQLLGGTNNILSLAISALIITISLRPVEILLVNTTDKFLFQKKYDYKQILKSFLGEVITLMNLDEIANQTLKILERTLHPYTASIFILNKVDDKYQLYDSVGLDNKAIIFASDSKLIKNLKRTRSPAIVKQVNGIAGVNAEVQEEMNSLKAVICLPLMLHDDLTGFISLGSKKSDEEYTKDDLDVLLGLAVAESVAVGNALLITEAAQAERRAAIGTMSAGINHEIGNPLNIINTKIQVFLEGVKRGLYKDKQKEEAIQECADILVETIKQTNRIAEITKKLSNFAKPSKEFKSQLVNIPEEVEEVLATVGYDLSLERIKIIKEFSSAANNILADKREMQQILFNIIRNAGQAIEDTGSITIRVFTTNDGKVRIEINDTGKGIAEDKTHRVFEPFFTTKGPNKGTGLGLSIVRQLVWKNKGEISFKSNPGEGTTFILEFPKGA